MLNTTRTFLTIAAITLLSAAPRADGDAARLLALADGFRGGFESGVVQTRLTNYDAERIVEEAEFEVSIKGDNSLVRFLSVRSKGQSLLMRGDDMWFFLPAVARPVRITPIQRLLGNVSNGDLARLRYSIDYDASIEGDAEADGVKCTVLELRARRKGATYQRVRYFVRKADARPVRAEYFLTSGKAIKTAVFGELREMGGRPTLTRIEIHDAMRPASKTTIDFLSITPRVLPDKLFSPARSEG
jgi:outer membrane lipoprotein-sorting protein